MCDEPKVSWFQTQRYIAQGEALNRADQRRGRQAAGPQAAVPKADNLTAKAATVACVCGGIVVLALAHTILHVLAVALVVFCGLAVAGGAGWLWWKIRSARPAPVVIIRQVPSGYEQYELTPAPPRAARRVRALERSQAAIEPTAILPPGPGTRELSEYVRRGWRSR
jgi:hypothetical protein